MAKDPKDVYREAVGKLLGPATDTSLAGRIKHLAGDKGIARGDLLRRLKIDSDALDYCLGAMLTQGSIELRAEQTKGRPRIIIVATGT